MGKSITRDELFDDLCKSITGDLMEIQPDDIPFCEVAKRTGVKVVTLVSRAERGEIPEGWEVVERRGVNGQTMKCYRKI